MPVGQAVTQGFDQRKIQRRSVAVPEQGGFAFRFEARQLFRCILQFLVAVGQFGLP